jgi:hypothetical protein
MERHFSKMPVVSSSLRGDLFAPPGGNDLAIAAEGRFPTKTALTC